MAHAINAESVVDAKFVEMYEINNFVSQII